MNINQIEEKAFEIFSIGSKVRIKGNSCGPHVPANEEGIVTAHGWSTSNEKSIGIKVPGELGSALLYNRQCHPASIELI